MHVLMLVNTDVTSDPRVSKEMNALAAAGHQLTVMGLRRSGAEPEFEQRPGIAIERFSLWTTRLFGFLKGRGGVKPSQSLVSSLRHAHRPGIRSRLARWVAAQSTQLVLLANYFSILVVFLWHGRKHRPDVIHAHDMHSLWPGYLLSRRHGIPLIYDCHENWYDASPAYPLYRRLTRWTERRFAPRCRAVITVNQSLAERMTQHYGIALPTVLLNVPQLSVDTPPSLVAEGEPLQLLFHGGYLPNRGLEQLVRAMALVKRPVHLTLRGSGESEAPLQRLTQQLGLYDRITFAPPVPMSALTQAASASHAGIIPYSKQVAEFALPNKMFEYMAAGLAVIANDLVEFRRVVCGHGIGLVCDAERPEAIAEAIDELAGDVDRLNDCRQAAWRIYHEEYAWGKHQAVLLDLYCSLE